jgi:hypothetical protein
MSDVLIGVIVGGVIASIAPITSLIINHLRWKREAKLEYLKSERSRLEKLYTGTLEKFAEAMAKNSYPSPMMSDIYVLMPKNVTDEVGKWITEKDKTELKGKHAYMDISVKMKRSLAEIDKQIKELVSK